MNVEKLLSEDLDTVARSVPTPPPPAVSDLVHRAERSRTDSRRRVAATLGLAAAVVLAVLAIDSGLGHREGTRTPNPAPQPTRLATGAPPAIPFVIGAKLYIDDRPLPGLYGDVGTFGATTLVSVGNSEAGDGARYRVLRSGRRVVDFRALDAIVSPDGSKVAYVTVGATSAHLVELDATTGRELGRTPLVRRLYARQGEEAENWESLESVAADGTVTYGGVVVLRTWKPGTAATALRPAPNADPLAGFPSDVYAVTRSPYDSRGAWLTDRDGTITSDSDGNPVIGGLSVQRQGEPSTRVRIELPNGINAHDLTWESPTTLLVTVYEDPEGTHSHYLRCSTTSKRCEYAPTPGG